MSNQTKLQILVALLLVWGGTVLFQYLDEAENPGSAIDNGQGMTFKASAGSIALAKSFTSPRQNMKLVTPRNIFSPFHLRSTSPSSSKKTKVAKATTTPKHVTPPHITPPPGPDPDELARQQARQQLNQFRFLGYLKKGGESQAFLTKGQSIYIVKQGTTVEGRILVHRIDPNLSHFIDTNSWFRRFRQSRNTIDERHSEFIATSFTLPRYVNPIASTYYAISYEEEPTPLLHDLIHLDVLLSHDELFHKFSCHVSL